MGKGDRRIKMEKREGNVWQMADLEAGTRGGGVGIEDVTKAG